MNEVKFGRILETGMGAIMSGTLNLTAMKLLGAPLALKSVLFGNCDCKRTGPAKQNGF